MVLLSFFGCATTTSVTFTPPERKIANPKAHRKNIIISKKELESKLGTPETVRFIEVYYRNQELSNVKSQYRLFDILPNGPLALLGLESGDLIVAAHGLVVPSPEAFKQYVEVLPLEKATSIELMRKGAPILLDITLVD